MRAPWHLLTALVLVGCPGVESDLRERIDAAGVFSPKRAVIGDERLVDLGQALFFDAELSGNRNIACATCHLPFFHAVDLLALPRGEGGEGVGPSRVGGPLLPRSVIPPFNRSFVTSMLWDGRIEVQPDGRFLAPARVPDGIETVLEAQALFPLLDRDEMRGQVGDNELADLADADTDAIWAAIVERLVSFPRYVEMFQDAYPGETTFSIVHVARALAAFEMQIWELTDTRFDDWLGDGFTPPQEHALFLGELAGADLFFGDAGCVRCHDGPLLSDMQTHNIGVPQVGPGKDPVSGLDEGRARVTGDPADRFAFRTPPLRNVGMTGPYMHDGAYPRLEDAIRHHLDPERMLRDYRASFRVEAGTEIHDDPATIDAILATLDPNTRPVRELGEGEISALAEFLRSLSSRTEEEVFPEAGIPFEVPSGLPVPSAF